jgi:hypothetical protein
MGGGESSKTERLECYHFLDGAQALPELLPTGRRLGDVLPFKIHHHHYPASVDIYSQLEHWDGIGDRI